MPNPIFNTPQSSPQQGGIFSLINQIRNSPDPNGAMQQLMMNDPSVQNAVNYIHQNGGNAKAAFYNMAAAKGIDPESILKFLR